jgi:hypothetical protein
MPAPKRTPLSEKDLKGFKYFQMLGPLLEHLHDAATERDRAGNRQLFFDQYAALLLLYFFNPVVTSLRGLQQATTLRKVQDLLGIRPTALGSLSEAARVFDAELLQGVIAELAARAGRVAPTPERAKLRDLTAVDGSLLPALPKMAWALWQDERHRAAKMHLAFEVVRQVPTGVSLTAGNGSEREQLRRLVRPGGTYVLDRGYVDYDLFQDLHDAGCSFLARLQDNAAYEVERERPLTEADRAAGVVRDCTIRRLGTAKHNRLLPQPFRVVVLATGATAPDGTAEEVTLATDLLDWPAELVALGFRYRWSVELFFRWLKCILGCRHLLSTSEDGVKLQVYAALIASLLIGLWVGRPATKRTYEMVCFYLSGWASEEELQAHLDQLHDRSPPSTSKC